MMFAMKVVLAVLIATLFAIESVMLAWLVIALFVSPGGSGEFTGINRFSYAMFALMFSPPPAFVIAFGIVLKFYKPENHEAFRNFAWVLIGSLATVPLVQVFNGADHLGPPWHLIINAIVLVAGIAIILLRELTRSKGSSFQASA